jgi:hypothetical protein
MYVDDIMIFLKYPKKKESPRECTPETETSLEMGNKNTVEASKNDRRNAERNQQPNLFRVWKEYVYSERFRIQRRPIHQKRGRAIAIAGKVECLIRIVLQQPWK